MGCTSSNLLNQDDDFTHHFLSLTSTTYGLLTLDPSSDPTTIAPTPPPRFTLSTDQPPDDVINSWELMGTHETVCFTPQPSKPSPFRYPFERNQENSNPNLKYPVLTRPGFSRFQENPNPDHKNPFFANPNLENPIFIKPLISALQENPNPDHELQENPNPDHELQENPNPDHKLQENPNPDHKLQENPNPDHKLQENPNPDHELQENPNPDHEFQENPNPDHEFQENPNPDHEFQETPNSDHKNVILTKPISSAFQENPIPDYKNPIFTKPVVSELSYLSEFEQLCPPKGENNAVIYTTTLRGVRRTFEACNAVRAVLEQSGVFFCERDISMDRGFKEELWELMKGKDKQECVPPRVFVKGRYVGGCDEVLRIVEEGYLGQLLEGLTKSKPGYVCETCGGARFLPCSSCNGSCKLVMNVNEDVDESDGDEFGKVVIVKCSDCNENGLVRCPVCS